MAGPFAPEDFARLVPPDKKLDPAWVRSLFARGEPSVYRGAELDKIGMPVGGLCAGQLYLGGDGRLWFWHLFNQRLRTREHHYAQPLQPASPLEQGFALRLNGVTRTLDRRGFPDIRFRGEYPIGRVEYRDPALPLAVTLEAFSPFIPLNTDDSSLPATVMQFTLRNDCGQSIEAELIGTLENAVGLANRGQRGRRINRVARHAGFTFLASSAEGADLAGLDDIGTMGLALLGEPAEFTSGDATAGLAEKLVGQLGRKLTVAAGQSAVVTFVLAWHFPNLRMRQFPPGGRYYATRFASAEAVAEYVAGQFERLHRETKLWRDTWYDSTLPYWFLDRTFLNTSTLATTTCHRFTNGRFYAWEGVGCCKGTCTSVWYYAQAAARLFPELERSVREQQDFADGIGFDPATGGIWTRAEERGDFVLDGQAGNVLRAYREHQMSADDAFLRRNWTKIRKALEWLIGQDGNRDGIIEGWQSTTLDCGSWWGAMSWTSLLYLAALRAGEEMARELGDEAFAGPLRPIIEAGGRNVADRLWNGEYFIHKPDRSHDNSFVIGNGCHIDQVYGQAWAHQVGLGRLLPERYTQSALRAIWKYNFTPDVGPFRERFKEGRWYAMAGEAGTIMTTWPRQDREYPKVVEGNMATGVGYMNEVWTGQEHQLAAHMIGEGMVLEGFAVERAIHDRHHPSRRNPYNEVECGDHYARGMASYGVFLAACGFEYHGPRGHIGFAPRVTPEHFKAAFTAAEGWGTFEVRGTRLEILPRWGYLKARTIALACQGAKSAAATLDNQPLPCRQEWRDGRLLVTLDAEVAVSAGQKLEISYA
jgi:uncharacterized protein (DUF608 family)